MNLRKLWALLTQIDARMGKAAAALEASKPDDAEHEMKFAKHDAQFLLEEMEKPGVSDEEIGAPTVADVVNDPDFNIDVDKEVKGGFDERERDDRDD